MLCDEELAFRQLPYDNGCVISTPQDPKPRKDIKGKDKQTLLG